MRKEKTRAHELPWGERERERAYVLLVDGKTLLHGLEQAVVAAKHISRVLALVGHRTHIFPQLVQMIERLLVLLQLLLGEGSDDELLQGLQKIDLVR
jgi:hypothetical protein